MTDPALLILASLAGGDKHGYSMIQDIQSFAGTELGPGTLYGAITRLEEQGWIAALHSEDRRKPYAITAAGKRHLQERMTALDQFIKTAVQRLNHQ
jgi:DNA-binding PadR family transcriptional regulator